MLKWKTTMSMTSQTDHAYIVEQFSADGNKWTWSFRADQIDDVRRRVVEHVLRENICVADWQQIDFALRDIEAIERLPPVVVQSVSSLRSLLDRICDWFCGGK